MRTTGVSAPRNKHPWVKVSCTESAPCQPGSSDFFRSSWWKGCGGGPVPTARAEQQKGSPHIPTIHFLHLPSVGEKDDFSFLLSEDLLL